MIGWILRGSIGFWSFLATGGLHWEISADKQKFSECRRDGDGMVTGWWRDGDGNLRGCSIKNQHKEKMRKGLSYRIFSERLEDQSENEKRIPSLILFFSKKWIRIHFLPYPVTAKQTVSVFFSLIHLWWQAEIGSFSFFSSLFHICK